MYTYRIGTLRVIVKGRRVQYREAKRGRGKGLGAVTRSS